jgi:hypothetical protein
VCENKSFHQTPWNSRESIMCCFSNNVKSHVRMTQFSHSRIHGGHGYDQISQRQVDQRRKSILAIHHVRFRINFDFLMAQVYTCAIVTHNLLFLACGYFSLGKSVQLHSDQENLNLLHPSFYLCEPMQTIERPTYISNYPPGIFRLVS